MIGNFDSFEEFKIALDEVNVLITQAGEYIQDQLKYSVFNKSAVILLMAKFESYLENVVDEFCFRLSGLKLKAKNIPLSIRFQASRDIITGDFLEDLERDRTTDNEKLQRKLKKKLQELSSIWDDECLPVKIEISNKFDYGKHGEKEIRRFFKRIGIDDVFNKFLIDKKVDGIDGEESYTISAASDINSLTFYRNAIIHSDSNLNITHDQIKAYKDNLYYFADKIDNKLYEWLKEIEESKERGIIPGGRQYI
jgi:hypothetical protein